MGCYVVHFGNLYDKVYEATAVSFMVENCIFLARDNGSVEHVAFAVMAGFLNLKVEGACWNVSTGVVPKVMSNNFL